MKVLVVYESMFGNTAAVARAIADGCTDAGARVALHPVTEVDPRTVDDYDLVIAGAPTHAWSLPRPSSRDEAARQGGTGDTESGLREWIARLDQRIAARPAFAVFDSRIGTGTARRFTGSAARRAARALRARHRVLADDPASFFVEGTSGPLLSGEDVRARAWGSRLARSAPVGS